MHPFTWNHSIKERYGRKGEREGLKSMQVVLCSSTSPLLAPIAPSPPTPFLTPAEGDVSKTLQSCILARVDGGRGIARGGQNAKY